MVTQLDRAEDSLERGLSDITEVSLETPSVAIRVVKQDVTDYLEVKEKELLGTTIVLPELDPDVGKVVVKVLEKGKSYID